MSLQSLIAPPPSSNSVLSPERMHPLAGSKLPHTESTNLGSNGQIQEPVGVISHSNRQTDPFPSSTVSCSESYGRPWWLTHS